MDQVSNGGAAFFAGKSINNKEPVQQASIAGSVAMALHVRQMAKYYGIPVVLHSDHCAKKLLPWFDGMLEADEVGLVLLANDSCRSWARANRSATFAPRNRLIQAGYISRNEQQVLQRLCSQEYICWSFSTSFPMSLERVGFLKLPVRTGRGSSALFPDQVTWLQGPLSRFYPKKHTPM